MNSLKDDKGCPLASTKLHSPINQVLDNDFLLVCRPILEDGLTEQATSLVHRYLGPVFDLLQQAVKVTCWVGRGKDL